MAARKLSVPARMRPAADVLTAQMMAGEIAGWSMLAADDWAIWDTEAAWQDRKQRGESLGATHYSADEIRRYAGTAPKRATRTSKAELVKFLAAILPTLHGDERDTAEALLKAS